MSRTPVRRVPFGRSNETKINTSENGVNSDEVVLNLPTASVGSWADNLEAIVDKDMADNHDEVNPKQATSCEETNNEPPQEQTPRDETKINDDSSSSEDKEVTNVGASTSNGNLIKDNDDSLDRVRSTREPSRTHSSKRSYVRKPVDKQYPVFVIKSDLSLSEIKKRIAGFVEDESKIDHMIGPMRIMRRLGKESDFTLCVFDRSIYEAMVKDGLDKPSTLRNFQVIEYKLEEKHFPKVPDARILYLPLPKKLLIPEVEKQLSTILNELTNFGIITSSQELKYGFKIPFEDRESKMHIGKCHIVWANDVQLSDIAIVKNILNDTRWLDSNGKTLDGDFKLRRCDWSRALKEADIEMSPAQRAYNYMESQKRQTRIRNRDRGTRDASHTTLRSSRKKEVPRKEKKGKAKEKKNPVKLPSPPPNSQTFVTYKPLTHVQPNSVREGPHLMQHYYAYPPYPMPAQFYPKWAHNIEEAAREQAIERNVEKVPISSGTLPRKVSHKNSY